MTETGENDKGRMLPGIAGICLFLLFLTILNVYAALENIFGSGQGKYSVLAVCTLLAAGLLGLMKMRRWGHALVMAACLLLSAGFFFYFSRVHQTRMLVWGAFMLVFFLYLVRPEVRDRMR